MKKQPKSKAAIEAVIIEDNGVFDTWVTMPGHVPPAGLNFIIGIGMTPEEAADIAAKELEDLAARLRARKYRVRRAT